MQYLVLGIGQQPVDTGHYNRLNFRFEKKIGIEWQNVLSLGRVFAILILEGPGEEEQYE
jgi:hypothetical protein